MKYTKEFLAPYVAGNTCMADVVRQIGVPASGGNLYHIGRMVKKHGLSTEHFDSAEAKGRWMRANPELHKKKPASEILVDETGMNRRRPGHLLARAMCESGVRHQCKGCGNPGLWLSKKLILHVDHIDGNMSNNVLRNLQFLCPNCHCQKSYTTEINRFQLLDSKV